MEFLIIVIAIGFSIYWLIRHPIKSIKFILLAFGIIALGFIGLAGILLLVSQIWS